MHIKMLSFFILFTCMRYPYTLIYYTTDVHPPQPAYGELFVRTYFYLWSSVRISFFYENPFESSYLWSSVKIFPFYENLLNFFLFMIICRIFLNLFLFMIICENLSLLWESFLISSYLWLSVRIFLNLFLFMIICENFFFLTQSFSIITIFFNYHNLF